MDLTEKINEFKSLSQEIISLNNESKKHDFFSEEGKNLRSKAEDKEKVIISAIKELSGTISEQDGKALISAISAQDALMRIASEDFFPKNESNYPVLRKLQFHAVDTINNDRDLKYIEAMGYDIEIRRYAIQRHKGRGFLIELFSSSANATIKDDISKRIRALPKPAVCSACRKPLQSFTRADCANNPRKTSYLCPVCNSPVCADCSYQAALKTGKNNFICPTCSFPVANFPARLDIFE